MSFNTVSNLSNLECTDYIANHLNPLGFKITLHEQIVNEVKKANIIARIGPETSEGIILSGHTDVVPFANQPGWFTEPLTLTEKNGKLYGRGTSDMKTFIAQCIDVCSETDFRTIKKPLVFIFTCDEEVCCQGSGRLVQDLPALFPNETLPKLAWIGEPTGFSIVTAHKGFSAFKVEVRTHGGHSSRPDLGVNSIEVMSSIIEIIKEKNREFTAITTPEACELYSDFPHAHMNLGSIKGGLADNMIAESCSLNVSLRMTTELNANQFVDSLSSEINQAINQEGLEANITLEKTAEAPAMLSDTHHPFAEMLSQLTQQPIVKGAPYATDGGQLAKAGIQSFICGPGELTEAHQPNEFVSIEQVIMGRKLVEEVIQKVCF